MGDDDGIRKVVSIGSELPPAEKALAKRSVGKKRSKPPVVEVTDADSQAVPAPAPTTPRLPEARTTAGVQPIGRWFVRCLVVGFVLALLTLLDHPIFHWIGILGPIGATLAYPLIGGALEFHKSPSQRERFADNCYYLGFIFTQIALLIGFLPVVLFDQLIGSQDVLRAFSLALGAALVGLVARTYFIQTGHTVSENSQLIEDEVEALAASVTRQAKVILSQFESLGGRLSGAYDQLNSELNGSLGSLTSTIRGYENALVRDMTTFEAGASAVTEATAQGVDSVVVEQQRFVSSLQEAVRGIEAIRAAAQAQLADATGAIKTSAQALAKGADAMAGASALGERLDAAEVRMEGAVRAAERLQSELLSTTARLSTAGSDAIVAIEGAGRDVAQGAVARAAAFEQELVAAVETLEKTLVSFRSELERVRV